MTQCQHIMATGRRCGTPAVLTHKFCYHHRRLHDNYCLPGDSAYEPEPLDSHQAITLQLHHLELAFNKGRIDIRSYRARLLAVRLAITNLKHAVTDTVTPAASVVTQYTPAMRDLHHLNPNQPCETANHLCEKCSTPLPVEEDTKPEPEEIIELEPLEPPCPREWLEPPDLPASKRDNARLWYHVPLAEMMTYYPLFKDELGDIKHENKRRRMFLLDHLKTIDNPTVFQIKDAIAKVEADERFQNAERAVKRQQLFQKHHGDLYPDLFPPAPIAPETVASVEGLPQPIASPLPNQPQTPPPSTEGLYQGIALSLPEVTEKIAPLGAEAKHTPPQLTAPDVV